MKKFHVTLKVFFTIGLLLAGMSLIAQPTMAFTGGGITQASDRGIGTPYPSTVDVTGIGFDFTQLTVTLTGLSHTSSNDINLILVGPSGAQCVLMSDVGGANAIDNVEYTFATNNPLMVTSNANPSGTYSPTNNGPDDNWPAPGPGDVTQPTPSLSVFDGVDADGTWSLYYNDDASDDSGMLRAWSITFTLPPVNNDDCLDAIRLSCGETIAGSTVDALPDDAPRCGSGTPGAGVWYEIDLQSSRFIQSVSTCNAANFNTRLSIYYGHCNRLRCLGSSDDSSGCGTGTAEMLFTPFFGRPHYVLVQSTNPGEVGDFELTYNCDAGRISPQGTNTVASIATRESLRLYPNPADDQLNVMLDGFSGREVTLRIHNSLGQMVAQRHIDQVEEQVERFNTVGLRAGMYLLHVQVEGGENFTKKFVVGAARL